MSETVRRRDPIVDDGIDREYETLSAERLGDLRADVLFVLRFPRGDTLERDEGFEDLQDNRLWARLPAVRAEHVNA